MLITASGKICQPLYIKKKCGLGVALLATQYLLVMILRGSVCVTVNSGKYTSGSSYANSVNMVYMYKNNDTDRILQ